MSEPAGRVGAGERPSWSRDDIVEAVLLGVMAYACFAYYAVVVRLAAMRGTDLAPLLHTRLDDAMPYMSVFAIPYALAYVMPVWAAVVLAREGGLPAFRRGFFGYLGLQGLHYAFYVAFPSSSFALMPSADALSRSMLGAWVRFFYDLSPLWNAFPSFHVAGCWFFYRVLARWAPRPARVYHAWFWTMAVGTAAIKIHWVVDGAAGFLAAEVYYRLVQTPLEARFACDWTWDSAKARLAAHLGALAALLAGLGLATLRFGWLLQP